MAVRSKRILFWNDNLVHLLGLVSTCLILLLFLHNEVFANSDDLDLSFKLNAVQFAAAVHANLLTMSLGLTAIAQTHHEMTMKQGIPLGLITAAYQLSSPEVLFSRAFGLSDGQDCAPRIFGFCAQDHCRRCHHSDSIARAVICCFTGPTGRICRLRPPAREQ